MARVPRPATLHTLDMAGGKPAGIHESGEHSQKHYAHHRNQGCDDRSTVAAKACEAHHESAYYGATNTHEGVQKRTVAITLEHLSGSPANDCPHDNPCE